jgi:hypothetical protein
LSLNVTSWDAAYRRHLLRRAAVLWLPIRALMAAAALAFGFAAPMGIVGTLLSVAVLSSLCAIDARFMRETIFQAQLGTPTWAPAAAGAAVALAAELAVWLVHAALAGLLS